MLFVSSGGGGMPFAVEYRGGGGITLAMEEGLSTLRTCLFEVFADSNMQAQLKQPLTTS